MPPYSKPFLTCDEQLDLIERRGLAISDRPVARQDLERIGYYRLSAYWYPWRRRPDGHREGIDTPRDEFEPGFTFENAVSIYTFDRQFRLILMDAIERIEVAIRVEVAQQIGRLGAFAYLDRACLGSVCDASTVRDQSVTWLQEFQAKMHRAISDSSESFAKHYRERYDGIVPIWVAIELWDFGMLSRFFQMMRLEEQEEVARQFGLIRYKTLISWLESLNLVRNICAHHGRLYKRSLANAPKLPSPRHLPELGHLRRLDEQAKKRLYPLLCTMILLMRTAAPRSDWKERLMAHLSFAPEVSRFGLHDYGFPEHWDLEVIWEQR